MLLKNDVLPFNFDSKVVVRNSKLVHSSFEAHRIIISKILLAFQFLLSMLTIN